MEKQEQIEHIARMLKDIGDRLNRRYEAQHGKIHKINFVYICVMVCLGGMVAYQYRRN